MQVIRTRLFDRKINKKKTGAPVKKLNPNKNESTNPTQPELILISSI